MPEIYREKHRVVYYETDVSGQISLGKLVDLLMLASYDQGKALGMSEEKLNEQGYGWVITQHLLEINRLPKRDEQITLETKATAYNRYFCYRDFAIYDLAGELLAKMYTAFVLLDLKTRKISRITEAVIAPFAPEAIKTIERLPSPGKLTTVDAKKEYQVRFWDIDTNHHVNNVHYIEWMLDALDADFLLNYEPVALNIKYEHELHYGDTCESKVQIIREPELITVHEIKKTDTLSCTAKVSWRPRQ